MAKYSIETFGLTKQFTKVKNVISGVSMTGMWTHKIMEKLKLVSTEAEKITAVDHVDLKIGKNELFGLLGPNGAGKTTLIKILCTLLIPDEGAARVDGFDIAEQPEMVRRRVNLVGSSHWVAFDRELTVRENLLFFSAIYGMPKAEAERRIEDALSLVGLTDRAADTPDKLSSGMRQKMVIARGFLLDTPIFFLDEPTVGLDPRSAIEVREYIKGLNKTIVLTTHYMREADQLCDRVAIIDRGRVVACDTPNNLKRRLRGSEILEVEGYHMQQEVGDLIKSLRGVSEAAVSMVDPIGLMGTLRVHAESVEAVTPRILDSLRSNGVLIRNVSLAEPSLEDVFMSLTGGGLG